MLAASALTSMREALNSSLPDTATIRTCTVEDDEQGGETRTWANGATVPCRLNRTTKMMEVIRGGKTSSVVGFELIVPYDTELAPENRVVISGVTYEVIGPDNGGAERLELVAMVYRVD